MDEGQKRKEGQQLDKPFRQVTDRKAIRVGATGRTVQTNSHPAVPKWSIVPR